VRKFVLWWLAFTQAISFLGVVIVFRFTLRLLRGDETGGQPFLLPGYAAFLTLLFLAIVVALIIAAWRQFLRGDDNGAVALTSLPLLITVPAIAIAFVRFVATR
jgi:hypothetical protein